ncbi:MAG: HTTM domain-containing protein [Verrucomicrobiales bacterium]
MHRFLASKARDLRRSLSVPVDGAALGLFRIVWGAVMVCDGFRMLSKATTLYSPDFFHFKFALTTFVDPFPENWMVKLEIWVLIFAAFMVMAGFGFRIFNTVFAVVYTHLFLIEKIAYNNHYYLIALLAFLLSLTAADRCFSVSSRLRRRRDGSEHRIPFWHYNILRLQVVIVYFFGGVSKLNADWLRGEPLRHWLASGLPKRLDPPLSWFPDLLNREWFLWTLNYGGLAFDLLIGFFLWHRKTFWPAAVAVVFFHVLNYSLFEIGFFPIVGIVLLLLFFQPHWPRPLLRKWVPNEPATKGEAPVLSPGLACVLAGFFALQILLPLRIHLYREDPSWSEVGHSFSWRMMLRDKDPHLDFHFNPPEAEELLEKLPRSRMPVVSGRRAEIMAKSPHLIFQYVKAVDEAFGRVGEHEVEIRVASVVSLNGRPFQLMIDPSVDLARASYGLFGVPDWIVPLDEEGRPGNYPASQSQRRREIEEVIEKHALPILAKVERKELARPVEEILAGR